MYCSETKIVTKADNTAQLTGLAEKASSEGLPHYIVHDAGKTQVKVILSYKSFFIWIFFVMSFDTLFGKHEVIKDLRNESNFHLLVEILTKKRKGNCINVSSILLQKFSDPFQLIFQSTKKKYFHWILRKETFFLTLFNAGLCQYLNAAVIHMTS